MSITPSRIHKALRALGDDLVRDANSLDRNDPRGERLSARELGAATAAATDAVRHWVQSGVVDPAGAKAHLAELYAGQTDRPHTDRLTFRLGEAMSLMHAHMKTALAIERGGFAEGPRSLKEADFNPAGPVTPSPEKWEDKRFYFVMVDRFANSDPQNECNV